MKKLIAFTIKDSLFFLTTDQAKEIIKELERKIKACKDEKSKKN